MRVAHAMIWPSAERNYRSTIDSWLIYNRTGRHITDVTNAGRTMLVNLRTLDWDDELLRAIGVPRAMLPEIVPSTEIYGEARGTLAGMPVAASSLAIVLNASTSDPNSSLLCGSSR